LIDAADADVEISLLIADRPDIGALTRAGAAGIPSQLIKYGQFADRDSFSRAAIAAAEESGAESLVLAGFMRILAPVAVRRYRNRILNIHPSLLPAFPGAHAVSQALAHGVKVTGVTVHFVDEEVDHGPIIAQRPVPVLPGDTEETLHERIQIEEHKIYPEVVSAFAAGRVRVSGREVIWS
jgi:phosphoribosylglycinamide formyltransferase-1